MIDCALDCCCRNVCALVSRAATATPARINVAVFERIERPPINHVTITAAIAPAKASSGVHDGRPGAVADVDDREGGAEAGAGGDAEQVGIGQGIAKDALVGPAGDRQHRAGQQSEHHPRRPQRPDDRRLQRRQRAVADARGARRCRPRLATSESTSARSPIRTRRRRRAPRPSRPRRSPPDASWAGWCSSDYFQSLGLFSAPFTAAVS